MKRNPADIIESMLREGKKKKEIAEAAGLDGGTVTRLYKKQIKRPSLETVEKLEKAERILLVKKPDVSTAPNQEIKKMDYDSEITNLKNEISEIKTYIIKIYSNISPGSLPPFPKAVNGQDKKN